MAMSHSVLLFICVCAQLVKCQLDPCKTVNEGTGNCVSLPQCQPYFELTKEFYNQINRWLLQQAQCGFEGTTPKVCCPDLGEIIEQSNLVQPDDKATRVLKTTVLPTTLTSTTTVPSTTKTAPPATTLPPIVRSQESNTINYDFLKQFGETCETVYNTTGSCRDIYLCEPLMKLANQAQTNRTALEMVKLSKCGYREKIVQVCCPLPHQSAPQSTVQTEAPSIEPRSGEDFLSSFPEPPVCGKSNIPLNRVVNGVPAKLGAFPWLALLGYKHPTLPITWDCGGGLVSRRHVLTAAHCIHNHEKNLTLVRLGELDLARDDEAHTVDIPIKHMFKHEKYTPNNPVLNDIGILVLQRNVEFTDMIKPICLFPDNKYRSDTFENLHPLVAGWGDMKWKGPSATHLQVAQVPVLGVSECEDSHRYDVRAKSRALFASQMLCAGYPNAEIDTCQGDSGGPLMQHLEGNDKKSYVYAIGIVALGRQCALAGTVGVYTRVTYFMPWIEEKMLGRSIN